MSETELRVTEEVRCRIVVAHDVEERLPELLGIAGRGAVVLLHDAGVGGLADRIAGRLGVSLRLAATPGEGAKSLREVERLARELAGAGVGRDGLLVCLGGGVVGDLGGFLAAIWQRGLPFALLPTSALAMLDAGIGGKTAVDLDGLKNAIGAFSWPETVAIDPRWLATLGGRELDEGLVELIKTAAMLSADVLDELVRLLPRVRARDQKALLRAIELAIELKTGVVHEDPHEHGRRALLNFGHTVGHALETRSDLLLGHGAAVAKGMLVELRMAAGVLARRAPERASGLSAAGAHVRALLGMLDLELPETGLDDAEALWQTMRHDKKARGGEVVITVPVAPGRGEAMTVERRDLDEALG